MRLPVPEWCKTLAPGDVVLFGRQQRPRVVRAVSPGNSRGKFCICFTIARCSWTKKCWTTYNLTDLLRMGIQPAGVRVKMNTELDHAIARDMEYINRGKPKLNCCDVHGVA